MQQVHEVEVHRHPHAHNQIAAAIFVGSLLFSGALVLAAELMKPDRYEYHAGPSATTYVIYDRDTGQATNTEYGSKNPIEAMKK